MHSKALRLHEVSKIFRRESLNAMSSEIEQKVQLESKNSINSVQKQQVLTENLLR